MRSLSTLVVLVAGALLCGSAPARAAMIFQDDFEGHALGTILTSTVNPPIGASYANCTYGVITASPTQTNTSHVVGPRGDPNNRTDWLNISAANQAAAQGQVVTFSFDAFVTRGSGSTVGGVGFGTFSTTSYLGRGWGIRLYRNGDLAYYDGTFHTIGTFATDQWNHVDVVADYRLKTFTATVGAVKWTGNFATATGNDTFNALTMSVDSAVWTQGVRGYYDNVLIQYGQVPEPSALLLLATGGVLACAWRKRK